jgi:hypothetical protein
LPLQAVPAAEQVSPAQQGSPAPPQLWQLPPLHTRPAAPQLLPPQHG